MDRRIMIVFIIATTFVGLIGMMLQHWERVDCENNDFAKDCNDRGGKAEFTAAARQCIGGAATRETMKKEEGA